MDIPVAAGVYELSDGLVLHLTWEQELTVTAGTAQ